MIEYSENNDQQIAEDFFKAPNGTTFCEKGCRQEHALFAVKLPLGGEERYSVVLAERLPVKQVQGKDIFPDQDWKLEVDSYVDNETGKRIICNYSSIFRTFLNYKEGIHLSDALSAVGTDVTKQLAAMSDKDLIQAALSAGKKISGAMQLSEDDRKRIVKDCVHAYIYEQEPACISDIQPEVDLRYEYSGRSYQAAFALSYLKDKKGLIADMAAKIAPKQAAAMLHDRAVAREAERYMEELLENPGPALVKEHNIRKAIEGKASIWATFGKGEETLRMSVPTAMFHSSKDLNDYALPEKDRRRLRSFLEDPNSRYVWYAHISDIVALDYKGKTLYRDEEFYAPHHNQGQTSPSFDSILQNAIIRADTQQHGNVPHKENNR